MRVVLGTRESGGVKWQLTVEVADHVHVRQQTSDYSVLLVMDPDYKASGRGFVGA
jgi:hypothetical protein